MNTRLTGILFALSLCAATVAGGEYGLDPSLSQDTVYFRSTAKLEFIEGETINVVGGFEFDRDNPSGPVSGIFRVDLRTLKTGIETRDRHMRENHLHTEDYPYAYFKLTSVSGMPGSFETDSTYQAKGGGYFYIRGVRRKLTTDLKLRFQQDGLEVRAKFEIKLDDYEIPRPKALFLKLAETIEVEVILFGHNDLPLAPLTLPDWPETD